jgi:Predicted membrane protein (DUF2142)
MAPARVAGRATGTPEPRPEASPLGHRNQRGGADGHDRELGRHGGSQSAYSSPVAPQARSFALVAPTLLAAFLGLLGAAWVVGNPPGGGTDEAAHYVKAIGVGRGDLYGRPLEVTNAELRAFLKSGQSDASEGAIGVTSKTLEWQGRTSREFVVPAGLGFPRLSCTAARPEVSARCLESGRPSERETQMQTYTGTYQPFAYAPAGLVMSLAGEPAGAVRLGRLAGAVLSLTLLALAGFLLWDGGRGALSLLGLIVAITPGVLFSGSILNPSGPEIGAAICFTAALLRLFRGPPASRAVWAAVGVGGAVLAFSRSFGPIFVLLIVLAVVAVEGPRRLREALAEQRDALLATVLVIGLAMAGGAYWEIVYQPHPSTGLSDIAGELGASISALPVLAREAVGVFGNLDTRMPDVVHVVWGALVLFLGGLAFALGDRRRRWSLIALAVSILVITVALSAAARQTGFQFQGRYILPLAVIFPLWAGEIVSMEARRLNRAWARAMLVGAAAVAAGVHLFAWYFNARRFAVGTDGPWNFIGEAEWAPPGGWVLWLLVAAAGAASCVAGGVATARAIR